MMKTMMNFGGGVFHHASQHIDKIEEKAATMMKMMKMTKNHIYAHTRARALYISVSRHNFSRFPCIQNRHFHHFHHGQGEKMSNYIYLQPPTNHDEHHDENMMNRGVHHDR